MELAEPPNFESTSAIAKSRSSLTCNSVFLFRNFLEMSYY